MSMFKEVADIKTADTLDLPRLKANCETVVVKPTELQQEMVKELSDRAAAVYACAGNIYQIWQETKADQLAQLAFCDFSIPNNKDGRCHTDTSHVTRDSLNTISEMMLYYLPSDDRFPFQGKK